MTDDSTGPAATPDNSSVPESSPPAQPLNLFTPAAPPVSRRPATTERGRPPIRLSPIQVLAIVLLAVFTVFITWRVKSLEQLIANRSAVSEMVSKSAPAFSLPATDGRTVSLSDYTGKIVVVSYWASWCGPCKVELPELRDFYNRYHKSDSTFEFLAISIDEQRSDAERYANEEKLPFPVLFDPDSKVADSFSVEAIPTLFIINKNGRINYAHTGLDESMQFRLMSELGIQFPGLDNGASASSGTKQ